MEKICPPRCKSDGSPFASFAPAVKQVNDMLLDEVGALQDRVGGGGGGGGGGGWKRVAFADCSRVLLLPDAIGSNGKRGENVDPNLMPDSLHPNAIGMTRWANCIAAPAEALMDA